MLPLEQVPLHIFEPRYRQLFNELEEFGGYFGMPFTSSSGVGVVSICELKEVTDRNPDGTFDVIVRCRGVQELLEMDECVPDKPYPGGALGKSLIEKEERIHDMSLLNDFAAFITKKHGTKPSLTQIYKYTPLDLAACLAMSNDEKVKLLQLPTKSAREKFLHEHIKYVGFLFDQEANKERGFWLN